MRLIGRLILPETDLHYRCWVCLLAGVWNDCESFGNIALILPTLVIVDRPWPKKNVSTTGLMYNLQSTNNGIDRRPSLW